MNYFENTHLKPVTYKTYQRQLDSWISLFINHPVSLVFLYTHPNYSVVRLRTHLDTKEQNNPRTVNAYIKALMAAFQGNSELFVGVDKALLTSSEERWKELFQLTYEKAFAYRMEQKPSPGQALKSGAHVSLEELNQLRDALPDGSNGKLLLGFYTYIPPVRADYYATQIIPFGKTPIEPNYIFYDSEHSQVVLTDFKTSRNYKNITNELPAELHKQLVLSLKANPRPYLFVNKNGEPFTRNGFTKWAAELLFESTKKGLTLTMLRHIYISSLDFNSSPAILQEIGKKMGHHITQQMLYKWKQSGTIPSDE
jgi:hypothetical protein